MSFVSLNLNSRPHLLLGVGVFFFFARQFQRWCIFQEPIVTPDGLGTVGMFTFESCVSGHALSLHFYRPICSGLFSLVSLALFVSPAPPSLAPPWSKCGEVEDVVGALTPVGSGVAQVFHDLLVELRLLLVAEVEEGEEEDRQEEGEEINGGSQVEETTTTWMAMMMVVSGVRTRLELEPM